MKTVSLLMILLPIVGTPCLAQKAETATYIVCPYAEITTTDKRWTISLPEKPEAQIESTIKMTDASFAPFNSATIAVDYVGKTLYYDMNGENKLFLGYKESQTPHVSEKPEQIGKEIQTQTFEASLQTFFNVCDYTVKSESIGKGVLVVGTVERDVMLIKTSEELAETASKPYRKIRVSHVFVDTEKQLPLFQTITDTLYITGAEKRVINFALYRTETASHVEETEDDQSIFIYPNPTKGKFTIDNRQNESPSVEIYNSQGALQESIPLKEGINELSIENLPTGTYLLRCRGSKLERYSKLIKQ